MSLPTGIICLWYGAIGNIPAGWTLCDGTAGTPDLRDKFLVGAGSTYAVGASGGNVNHNHTFIGNGHTHDIPGGSGINSGVNVSNTTNSANAAGTTNNANGLPPYHALAYIMKT